MPFEKTDQNRTEWSQTIRAKCLMDGAETLTEAAAKRRVTAEHLEQMERDGWQLSQPIEDDYGYVERDMQPLLSPEEIKAIRKHLGLSRAEFARLTRIGEASLARWETGHIVQNAAMDNYLRLLSYEENVKRIAWR